MTRYAPFHLERIFLKNGGHVIDGAVTGRASDAFRDVDTVIKVCVFGQVVDALPFDRLIVTKTRSDGFEIRAVRPYLAVTVHAGLRGGHPGGRGRLDRLMTIAAVYAVVADVMLVTELDGLHLFHITPGQIRRPRELGISKAGHASQYNRRDHADPGDIICTFLKKLRHL